MAITPRLIAQIWISILIISNIYGLLIITGSDNLNEIYHGHIRPEKISLFINAAFIFVFYAATCALFCTLSRPSNKEVIDPYRIPENSRKNIEHLLMAALSVYIYSISSSGIGAAGGVEIQGGLSPAQYFFILFRVDYFAIIYSFLFKINRRTTIILVLVLISSLMRGWLGDVLLIFLLAVASSRVNIKDIVFSRYSLMIIAVLLIYDPLMQARMAYRIGGLELALNQDYSTSSTALVNSVHGFLIRFQQIYSLQYFYENIEFFSSAYQNNQITPIYFEGAVPKKIYDTLTGYSGESIGYMLADHNRVLIEGRKTAFSSGVIPYAYLDPVSFIYILLCPAACGLLVSRFPPSNLIRLVVFMYLINLFSFGWGNAFFSFLTTLVILVFVVSILQKKTERKKWRPHRKIGIT